MLLKLYITIKYVEKKKHLHTFHTSDYNFSWNVRSL